MANPQTENGFTRLADELLDALILYPFTKRQYKVLLAVIRKTYGFQKREDDITAPQIAGMTGLDRANVIRAINELVVIGALSKRPGHYGQVLGINKDYEVWQVPKQHPSTSAKTAPDGVLEQHRQECRNDTGVSAETAPSIENHQQTLTKRQPPPQSTDGSSGDLIFPKEMQGVELREARVLIQRAGKDAQAVLDVLTVAVQAGEIRKSRLAVLTGLIRRYESGTFDPAPGMHLAEQRRRAVARKVAEQKREQKYTKELEERAQSGVAERHSGVQQLRKGLNRGRAK